MLGDLGCILTALAFVATVYGGGAAFVSIRRSDPRWWESARHAFYGAAALLGLAIVVLVQAFLEQMISASGTVVQHSSRVLPGYLKVSAGMAGQEGFTAAVSFLTGPVRRAGDWAAWRARAVPGALGRGCVGRDRGLLHRRVLAAK